MKRLYLEGQEQLRSMARSLTHPLLDTVKATRIWLAGLINPPTFTYFVSTPFGEIEAGKSFDATVHVLTPYQIIDIVAVGPASTFKINSLFVGDESMMLGAGYAWAEMFAPTAAFRFGEARFPWCKRGDTIQIRATNASAKKATLTICLKVKSYRSYR
jgi:hypothetical protein